MAVYYYNFIMKKRSRQFTIKKGSLNFINVKIMPVYHSILSEGFSGMLGFSGSIPVSTEAELSLSVPVG